MALFGSTRPRPTGATLASLFPSPQDRGATIPGVVPYFPTPEERASALPGDMSSGLPKPVGGMLGSRGFGEHISAALQSAGAGPAPGGVLASALGQAANPAPSPTSRSPLADALDLPAPTRALAADLATVDLSNARVKHPGFFQHGGVGEKILHGLGEFALRYSASQGDPFALMTLRGRMEQQAQQQQMIAAVRQRQAEREEWMWREQWKRDHPDDQFTQYLTAAGIDPASPRGRELYRQRAEGLAAPPLMAVDGFDAQGNPTKTFMPRPTFGGGGYGPNPPAPPTQGGPAVGTIRNGYRFVGGNPNDRASWQPVSGGAGTQANVPFGR